jgi:hypothetical protein
MELKAKFNYVNSQFDINSIMPANKIKIDPSKKIKNNK